MLTWDVERVAIPNLNPANPSFIDSLPVSKQSLADDDQLHIAATSKAQARANDRFEVSRRVK